MRELKCPKCGNVFSVDEADYASIVNQVKGAEFDAEVSRRLLNFISSIRPKSRHVPLRKSRNIRARFSRKTRHSARRTGKSPG